MAKKRASGSDADELLDALYVAPPRAFVGERKRVADALEAAGRADEAKEVARRHKPTASVWAVNQLARRTPDDVAELLALGATLRAGQRKLLHGGGAADGFMADARTARQKVAALARRAEGFIAEAGQKATATLGRKIAQTLQAASLADDETRAKLEAGRLDADLTPPSSFGGAAPSEKVKEPEKKREPARRHKTEHVAAERRHAAAERKHAAAELRAQRRAQAAARKHAATLARAATAAERAVAERARAVDKARAAVERAEAGLRAAKDALADAETAAAAARRAADEAATSS